MRAEPDTKDLVIYYDCCVPSNQFKKILIPAIRFAEHLFCREIFPEAVQRDDRKLFSAVCDHRQALHGEKFCLFITTDSDFQEQVETHPDFNQSVCFLYLAIQPSEEMNWFWAKNIARKLLEVYMELLELKARRVLPGALLPLKFSSFLKIQFGTA